MTVKTLKKTLERVKYTIKEFAEMIEKGAEIHPALQAPESVQNLFRDFKNVSKIESKIKQLAEKSQEQRVNSAIPFMLQLTAEEAEFSRFQFGILKKRLHFKCLHHVLHENG